MISFVQKSKDEIKDLYKERGYVEYIELNKIIKL